MNLPKVINIEDIRRIPSLPPPKKLSYIQQSQALDTKKGKKGISGGKNVNIKGILNNDYIDNIRAVNLFTNTITYINQENSVALNVGIGSSSNISQGYFATSIGSNAGHISQGDYAISIGKQAGEFLQPAETIFIGPTAGYSNHPIYGGERTIAIGASAGYNTLIDRAIAIGKKAKESCDVGQIFGIGIGYEAARYIQNTSGIGIGLKSAWLNQGFACVAIGENSAFCNQFNFSVAIGKNAGNINQGRGSVGIGYNAAYGYQGRSSVSIGAYANYVIQGDSSIAIGHSSGKNIQKEFALSIGCKAGENYQNQEGIAIGYQAGQNNQQQRAVAIGYQAGQNNQGFSSVAIGPFAGSINQASNSLVINASPSTFDVVNSDSIYINPIREISDNSIPGGLSYRTSNKEVVWYSNAIKTFIIDHPIHDDKLLVHACLEGPEVGVYYRGIGEISNNKETLIYLPDYVKHIAKKFTIFISPMLENIDDELVEIFSSDIIDSEKFFVYEKNNKNCKFSWMVYGEREPLETEVYKNEKTLESVGPYTFLTDK